MAPDHLSVPVCGMLDHVGPSPIVPSSQEVAARMSRQARKDTRPEMAVRRQLHAAGLRYRVQQGVPGMPRRSIDIAFTRLRLAVFIDGCFWHGCPVHATSPKANAEWWRDKLARNIVRDTETTEQLQGQGWVVLRFWEHEAPAAVVDFISGEVARLKADSIRRGGTFGS